VSRCSLGRPDTNQEKRKSRLCRKSKTVHDTSAEHHGTCRHETADTAHSGMVSRHTQRAAAEKWVHSPRRRPPIARARPHGAKWGEPGHSKVPSSMYPMLASAPPRCEPGIAPQYPPTDGTDPCRLSARLTDPSFCSHPGQIDEIQAISPQMRVGRRAPRAPPTCTMPCVCGTRRGYRYRPSVLP
jgi:hypothetical protein